jgi:hypothetical protein
MVGRNPLFSASKPSCADTIRPHLPLRARSINKHEMTAGIKTGMDETVAKSMKDFTNSNVLLYMHEHVVEYREAIRLYVGYLSDNAVCESLGSKSTPASKPISRKKSNHDAEYAKIMGQKAKTSIEYIKAKTVSILSAKVDRKRKLVERRIDQFRSAVLELDFDPDDLLAPRQRKKELKNAENRRIDNHRRWKARHPSEDFSSSQDTCASESRSARHCKTGAQ